MKTSSELKRIETMDVLDNYQVFLVFDDGVSGIYDFSKLIGYQEIYEPLKDYELFSKLKNDGYGFSWGNGIDVASEFVYDNLKIS